MTSNRAFSDSEFESAYGIGGIRKLRRKRIEKVW
jgi:hypothetical protein